MEEVSGASGSGRGGEYHEACAAKAAALRWHEVVEICGPRLQAVVRVADQVSFDLLSASVPERLRMTPVQVVSITPEHSVNRSDHVRDPVTNSRRLWDLLPRFDGRSCGVVVAVSG